MNPNKSDAHFDELDQQIRAALQVDVSPLQIKRLETFWRDKSLADRRQKIFRRFAAMAAMILIVLAASHKLWSTHAVTPSDPNQIAGAAPATPTSQPKDAFPESRPIQLTAENAHSMSHGRPATAYEQIMFSARSRQRKMVQRNAAFNAIDNVVERLAGDPNTDPRQLLASAGIALPNAEQFLLRRLNRPDEPRRETVLQLLAVCGTPQSTAAILQLSRDPAMREQALRTLEQTVGSAGLARAATQTNDAGLRTAIYRRLLANATSLDAYLSLVQNDFLRDEVLVVADELPRPIIDALLQRLNADKQSTRLAAAFVLGHANGPIVTKSLIDLVSENPASPTEAWLALIARRGQQADQFLTYATRQPRLLGHFNRARVYWSQTIH